MYKNVRTLVFDLDGTVYQNLDFHQDYLHFLVQDTAYIEWESSLVEFVTSVFAGRRLVMNRFYKVDPEQFDSPEEFYAKLEQCLCPMIPYVEAFGRTDLTYLGDAWAVVTFIGEMLGVLEGERSDLVYRRVRRDMEEKGMEGSARLKAAIQNLIPHYKVILMSNSYEDTAREFLRQLDYEDLFPNIYSSANKPFEMITKLEQREPGLFTDPKTVLSIGDHAYNDLMPIAQKGGRTVWINPFKDIARPACDLELATLDDLAGFLETMVNRH